MPLSNITMLKMKNLKYQRLVKLLVLFHFILQLEEIMYPVKHNISLLQIPKYHYNVRTDAFQ